MELGSDLRALSGECAKLGHIALLEGLLLRLGEPQELLTEVELFSRAAALRRWRGRPAGGLGLCTAQELADALGKHAIHPLPARRQVAPRSKIGGLAVVIRHAGPILRQD